MERVSTLIKKLQRQLAENASAQSLLHTVQMLQAELQSQSEIKKEVNQDKVSVIMPMSFNVFQAGVTDVHSHANISEEKVIEVLQVDEKEIEEELKEIKRNAEAKNKMSINSKPPLLFDPMEDVPTLTHQDAHTGRKEINEVSAGSQASLNERLKEIKTELGDKLTEGPIKDLRKAIGVNDRFLFINELFRGDEAMYERSIKTINNFSILAEAEFWIRRELKLKIGWRDADPFVKQFDHLVRRRFA